jgi:hypothetical protein
MTASKSSIHDATKAVSSFPGSTSESLGVIVQIMREVLGYGIYAAEIGMEGHEIRAKIGCCVSLPFFQVGQASKRVPLWYLMDSVAQVSSLLHSFRRWCDVYCQAFAVDTGNFEVFFRLRLTRSFACVCPCSSPAFPFALFQYAKRKGNVKLSAAVLATVPAVIPLMLDPASGGDAKGEEAVTKVLDVWERHKIYTGDEIASALKVTAPLAPLAPHSPILPPPPDPHTVGSSLGDGALLPTPLLPTPIMERPAPARTAVDAQLERTYVFCVVSRRFSFSIPTCGVFPQSQAAAHFRIRWNFDTVGKPVIWELFWQRRR